MFSAKMFEVKKARVTELQFSVVCLVVVRDVLIQYANVTDRWTRRDNTFRASRTNVKR